MKKTFIAILLVLIVSSFSVFALEGVTFYTGLGYDLRKASDNKSATSVYSSHAMELEAGAQFELTNGFSLYSDIGLRFVGGGKVNNGTAADTTEIKKGLFGTNAHVGILYGIRLIEAKQFEAYIGAGLSYANTTFNNENMFFNNFGVGLKLNAAYRINDTFAVSLSNHTDLTFFNTGKLGLGYAESITLGALYSF